MNIKTKLYNQRLLTKAWAKGGDWEPKDKWQEDYLKEINRRHTYGYNNINKKVEWNFQTKE